MSLGNVGTVPCDDYAAHNSAIPFGEIVRFDERENAGVTAYGSTDNGGWTYFNLNNPAISARAGPSDTTQIGPAH